MSKKNSTNLDRIIGNRLRQRRMELGITQTDLADALGISFQQIQKYEKGTNRISASRLPAITETLQCDAAFLMGDLNNGKKPPTMSRFATFMTTRDGAAILDAMIELDEPHRKAVLGLVRTLANAYAKT
jgi:transcriptional regulator with XRE-family HTH domain